MLWEYKMKLVTTKMFRDKQSNICKWKSLCNIRLIKSRKRWKIVFINPVEFLSSNEKEVFYLLVVLLIDPSIAHSLTIWTIEWKKALFQRTPRSTTPILSNISTELCSKPILIDCLRHPVPNRWLPEIIQLKHQTHKL